jgi:hypothetical protein
MFNQLLKWTLVISIWRKYKRHIGITIILILALFLTSLVHQDFVNYSLVSDNSSLGLSYLVKWLVYLVLVSVYWFSVGKINENARKDSDLHKKMKASKQRKPKSTILDQEDSSSQDPFANIRGKKNLRSKADIALEKQSKNPKV